MEKCLVTKLQAVVNDPSLKYLNEVDIVLNGSITDGAGQRFVQFKANEKVTVKSTIMLYSDQALTTELGTEFDVPADTTQLVYFASLDGTIRIIDGKGKMKQFISGCGAIIQDIGTYGLGEQFSTLWRNVNGGPTVDTPNYAIFNGDLSLLANRINPIQLKVIDSGFYSFAGVYGHTSLLSKFTFVANSSEKCRIRFYNSDIYGDTSVFNSLLSKTVVTGLDIPNSNISVNVEDFSDYVNLEQFNTDNNSNVIGNLATGLGNMTKLNYVYLSGHSASEDLKSLFDTLHTNGKISGSIRVWAGSNKTLDGGTWTNGSTVTFNTNGWTVN